LNIILTPFHPSLSSSYPVGFNINTNIPTYLITSGGLFNAFKFVNSFAFILFNAAFASIIIGSASANIFSASSDPILISSFFISNSSFFIVAAYVCFSVISDFYFISSINVSTYSFSAFTSIYFSYNVIYNSLTLLAASSNFLKPT